MTSYGKIQIKEQTFTREGKLMRPFSDSAKIKSRGKSKALQERMVDLGSDMSYSDTCRKIKKYWNVDLAPSSTQIVVNKHAKIIEQNIDILQKPKLRSSEPKHVIKESDGSMIPLVSVEENYSGDRRKTRQRYWKEIRLSLAYVKGDVDPAYSVSMDDVDAVGKQWSKLYELVGGGEHTSIHFVSDGAQWIANQVEKIFGAKAHFLIDYFHLSEYLNKAGICCNPTDPAAWAKDQGNLMKIGKTSEVISKLEQHIKYETQPEDHICEAEICYNYMIRRLNQFNYKEALASDLPIGSGKIEGGHKSVIQRRLKIPGAAWRVENASAMASLRVLKANGNFNNYWSGSRDIWANAN